MQLGIMVTTDRLPQQLCGIVEAALGRGHAVAVFATDEGVRLLADPGVRSLAALPSVTVGYCDHSARRLGVDTHGLPGQIVRGSQLENAIMCTESDKVIVL